MALKIYDTFAPQGNYPAVNAQDVAMPDGSRLSAWNPAYPVQEGAAEALRPETYYRFGEVDDLAVILAQTEDDLAHEYLFEFTPTDNFTGLTIAPEVTWVAEPQFPPGKRCIVSVCMGLAVMGCG